MRLFRSKKVSAAKKSRNIESVDSRSSVQSLKSRLFACIPIKPWSFKADVSPPQQKEAAGDLLPIKSRAQYESVEESCHFPINPLYTEDPATEQYPAQLSHPPERLFAQPLDQPVLMPKPLQNQAEKLRAAEKAIIHSTQQLHTHKQMHLEVLSKLSEQHEYAMKEVHAEAEHQLRQQQLAHERVIACVHAQHVRDVQRIIRKHKVVHTQASDVAQAKFDMERTQQQSLHEQALRGQTAELSRQARQHCMSMAAQYKTSMQSLKARHNSQLKQQQIRLSAEHQADKQAHRLEIAALQSRMRSAQEETETLHSKLVKQQQQADGLSHARLDAEAQESSLIVELEKAQAAHHELLADRDSLKQDLNTLKPELHDSRRGRSEADDQEDQLKASLPHAHPSVATQVDPAAVGEVSNSKAMSHSTDNGSVSLGTNALLVDPAAVGGVSNSKAISDSTHTGSASSGTNTLPCLADLQRLQETVATMQADRDALTKKLPDDKAGFQKNLSNVLKEVQATSAERDGLAEELAARNTALSACQEKCAHLMVELVSYRAKCREANETVAAFIQQHNLEANRPSSLCRAPYYRGPRLEHISTNDSTNDSDLDPEFPPGFGPAVCCARQSPGLHTESKKTHLNATSLSSSTSAAGQLSFSLAVDKHTQAPSSTPLPRVSFTTRTPSTGFLDRARSMPPGLRVASQAEWTAPLPVNTRIAAAEVNSHETANEMINGDAPAPALRLKSRRLGTRNHQYVQQRSSHCSTQSGQAPQQSGWDVDSDSEPGAAWTVDGNKQHSWDTRSQQDSKAFSMPRRSWWPDQFQGTPAQGSRRGATRRNNMAAEKPFSHEKKLTIADMAMDDGAAEGGSAAMDVGPAFLDQSQIRDMSSGSPKTEDMVMIDGAAAVGGGVTAAKGGSTAVECGGAALEDDFANMEYGIAGVVGGGAAESMAEAEGVQDIPLFAATAYAPAAAEAPHAQHATTPSPPRRVAHVTRLPPSAVIAMSANERQSHQESLHRVTLCHDHPTSSVALGGAFVTPMPPQLHTNTNSSVMQDATAEQPGTHEMQEQRAYRRNGRNDNAVGQAPELHGGSMWDGEQADASWQGNETQATAEQPRRRKTRGNNKLRRWKASQKAASAGHEH